MALFWVLTPEMKQNGTGQFGFVFDCAAATVDDLVARLVKDIIVAGSKLTVRTDDRGNRLVMKRQAIAITARGIAQVQAYEYPIRELQVPQAIMTGAGQ